MKRVLQISNYFYPHIGGIEQVARDFADVLSSMNDIVQKVICFNEDANSKKYECHREVTTCDIVDGIEIIRCGCVAKVASQSLSLTFPYKLKCAMNEFRPDIVVFHYPNPYVAHFLLQYKERDFKLIVYWHLDITKQKILKKLFHGQNLALIKRANLIVGATPNHINESAYSSYFAGKKMVLPYAINEERLKITKEETRIAEEIRKRYPNKVLGFFIGRHVPYKGLRYLIEASRQLGECNIHFLVAGEGELTTELKELAKSDSKIEFVGKLNDKEWRSYLYACDIFCFPSITRNEAFGLALAEAMYYGKPAVTFTIPGSGINYLNLNGITGIECPNSDSAAYAKALQKLADDEELRHKYGKAARQRVLDNFSFQQFSKKVVELLQ